MGFCAFLMERCGKSFFKANSIRLIKSNSHSVRYCELWIFTFLLFTSNPFERLLLPPLEGRELNPLLQDFGLAVHPPMLYMGYVGLAVPFAFVVSALIRGQLDSTWLRWTRPWALISWAF